MLRLLFLTLLYSTTLWAADAVNCQVSTQANNSFVRCENNINGYAFDNEQVESFRVNYRDSNGNERTEMIPFSTTIRDLSDSNKVKEILERGGITGASGIRVESISLNKKSPLYKDPEKIVLKSGCQFQGPPVVVSYNASEGCNDYICVGSVECLQGANTESKDAVCKGNVSQEGVRCPSANSCLQDQYVTVETYISPSQSRGSPRGSNSPRTIQQ